MRVYERRDVRALQRETFTTHVVSAADRADRSRARKNWSTATDPAVTAMHAAMNVTKASLVPLGRG
jgi:hypothetical protein